MKKAIGLILILSVVSVESFSAKSLFPKDANSFVPSRSIHLNKEAEGEVFAELEKSKINGKKVQAIFVCDFSSQKVDKDEALKACTLKVVRHDPN